MPYIFHPVKGDEAKIIAPFSTMIYKIYTRFIQKSIRILQNSKFLKQKKEDEKKPYGRAKNVSAARRAASSPEPFQAPRCFDLALKKRKYRSPGP